MRFNYLLISLIFLACGKSEERYLYDKDSPEYGRIKAVGITRCVNKSNARKAIQNAVELEKFNGKTYKISAKFKEDGKDPVDKVHYLRFENYRVDEAGPKMTLKIRSTLRDKREILNAVAKDITFTQEQMEQVVNDIMVGICDKDVNLIATPEALQSGAGLTFTAGRAFVNDKKELLLVINERFHLTKDMPIFSMLWLSERSFDYKEASGEKEIFELKASGMSAFIDVTKDCTTETECIDMYKVEGKGCVLKLSIQNFFSQASIEAPTSFFDLSGCGSDNTAEGPVTSSVTPKE